MKENKNDFKPYIPADQVVPEFTVTALILGILLAVIFGAANAYLGLRVGMTVSASIPAAVLSMGIIRIILRKNSILENNLVQTIGSAGESLAAGAIFTMPALFLWAEEGLCEMPGIVEITLIALCGGVLGVLFMVPLRNALIVKEHATLLYPEGTACADVLLAGEEGGANAATVFSGMGIAAIFKFVVDGLKVIPADVAVAFKGFKGEIGMECYPALLGVGYIVGPRIASFMFVGSLIGWMVLIPVICLFGADTVMYPGTETISALYAAGGASKIWSTYVKYIGAGAIATGGIISLIKSLPLIIATFRDSMKSMKGGKNTSTERTAQDLPMNIILIGIVAGYIIAAIMGLVLPTTAVNADGVEYTKAWVLNWDKVANAAWFSVPKLMPVKLVFDWRAIIPVLIMFVVTAVETVGDISGVMEGGMGREATDKELSGGVICDGIGSSLAALFGVLPNTSFSQNVGLVTMTKIVNRMALASGAVFLILCGLFPKLAALISIMPQSVLGGAAVMMFSSIVISGIQLITKEPMTMRNITIVSVALGLGYGIGSSSGILAHLPQGIQLIFGGSGIVPCSLAAIILNIVLPKESKPVREMWELEDK